MYIYMRSNVSFKNNECHCLMFVGDFGKKHTVFSTQVTPDLLRVCTECEMWLGLIVKHPAPDDERAEGGLDWRRGRCLQCTVNMEKKQRSQFCSYLQTVFTATSLSLTSTSSHPTIHLCIRLWCAPYHGLTLLTSSWWSTEDLDWIRVCLKIYKHQHHMCNNYYYHYLWVTFPPTFVSQILTEWLHIMEEKS